MSDFADILERSVDEIEEPRAIPMGTWRFSVISGKLMKGKNVESGGPVADALFTVKPVEALDDVNEVELEAFGDQLDGSRAYRKIGIWDRRNEWDVVRFLNTLGYEFEQGDTLGESITKAKGYEFVAYVKHADNPNDEDHPYVNLEDIKAA